VNNWPPGSEYVRQDCGSANPDPKEIWIRLVSSYQKQGTTNMKYGNYIEEQAWKATLSVLRKKGETVHRKNKEKI
jgi:hypothetical protein